MPERAHVPKFGKWESYGTSPFPYTQYFEKARADRQGAKVTNPNDPHHNPEAFHADITPNHASPTRNAENDIRRHDGSPLHHNSVTHSSTLGSPRRVRADQMAPGGHRRRQDRANDVFDDNRGKRSPVHPSYQVGFGGAYSPPEGLSADNHPYTSKSAGRLRMAGLQDDKKIKKGSLVPKFGEWDETLPYTADGYSAVFSKVREEKQREMIQAGPVVVPSESNPKAYNNTDHEPSVGLLVLPMVQKVNKFLASKLQTEYLWCIEL